MAFAVADRVRELPVFGGGTGAVTLSVVASPGGYQTFLAGWGASGTGWYCLSQGVLWETGLGTLNAGGTTLTRTTVFHGSSGAGVAVSFAAGALDCFGDMPAAKYGNFPGNITFGTSGVLTDDGSYTILGVVAQSRLVLDIVAGTETYLTSRIGVKLQSDNTIVRSFDGLTNYAAFNSSYTYVYNAGVATSPTTGGLRTAGGVGIAGALFVGGAIDSGAAIDAQVSFNLNGSYFALRSGDYTYIYDDGGLGRLLLGNAATPTSQYRNDLHYFYNAAASVLNLSLDSTSLIVRQATASTSTTTGALRVLSGGAGIAGQVTAGSFQAGATAPQYNAYVSSRIGTAGIACFEFGHQNTGYGSCLACNSGGGQPYIAFAAGPGTNANTFKTIGSTKGSVIQADLTGGIIIAQVATAATDNQSLTNIMTIAPGGAVLGAPTGGVKGAGMLNAVSVYDDNVLLTCFGTQYLKYGAVDLKQWDALSPTGRHELAHKFAALVQDFDPSDPDQYIKRMLRDEALPGMPTVADWQHNQLSLGEMHNRLWLAVEMLAAAFVGSHTEKTARR